MMDAPPNGLTTANAAARIRAARNFADLSQPQLAERIGKTVATLKRMERGQRDTDPRELVAVADACGIPRRFMLEGFDAIVDHPTADDMTALQKRLEAIERRIGPDDP
jgi:transcriptional regulator with XRE-family HTH domain